MEIKIKKIGEKKGCIGWLEKEISDGNIIFSEFTSRSGGLCLQAHIEGREIFIAGKLYGEYVPADMYSEGTQLSICLDWCTGAVRDTIRTISEGWIKERGKEEAEESPLNVTVKVG
jgi:hypothetical protein